MTERAGNRDLDYLINRAREEREMAATTGDLTAALVHRKLAAEYERRAGREIVGGRA